MSYLNLSRLQSTFDSFLVFFIHSWLYGYNDILVVLMGAGSALCHTSGLRRLAFPRTVADLPL